ncbi:MFS transporter [Schumannella sp. 10F1B-5-1]|uniref:MFS transporter n=1 Tax=Schumannella sp. 10F1B-5-1 TaxID=2590780 RepID=UPI0011319A48|nr:MFS transporter [Schumannella sp. 10F1B-5-1]TPW73645.1 MFS transporter [Schumannella sp. 10F1B-5-1]
MTALASIDALAVHRRTRGVLVAGQVLAGLGMGSTLSAGALLATLVSGSEAWSGSATTGSTVGSALAAIPLAALAQRAGRAPALATGALTAALGGVLGILAAVWMLFPLLLVAFVCIGVGTAVNLQSRFAATDLSQPSTRGRDLSIVVWATTVGAVIGPNLISSGNRLGLAIGLPELAGPFLLTIAAQAVAAIVCAVGLRPDPLRLARDIALAEAEDARRTAAEAAVGAGSASRGSSGVSSAAPASAPRLLDVDDPRTARIGIAILGLSHATMASVMAMTPVHLTHSGATLEIVGLTISLHVAGMYALSPLWGVLADRLGRPVVIGFGQGMLLLALVLAALGSESEGFVVAALILLGLGWSASTVAGSAMIVAATSAERRTRTQGRADLVMSSAGAVGGALAGPVLALLGYPGLALAAVLLVAVASALLAWRALSARAALRIPA